MARRLKKPKRRGRKKLTRWFLVASAAIIFAGLIWAWIAVLVAEVGAPGSASTTNQQAFGELTALLVLIIFTGIIWRISGGVGGFIVGKDNRVSTSKLQVVVWTYAIAGAVLALVAMTWVGPDTGFDVLTGKDFDFAPYLVLLGGPFAAAILARTIVSSQIEDGEISKPTARAPKPSQAFTGDDDKADFVDCQYLLFNIVALVYFLGAFIDSAAVEGLPNIPTLLFALTSASAAGYVSNKAIASTTPSLIAVHPSKGPACSHVELIGTNFLYPDDVRTVDREIPQPMAEIGGRQAEIVSTSRSVGTDRIMVKVPNIKADVYEVVALSPDGLSSSVAHFEVVDADSPCSDAADSAESSDQTADPETEQAPPPSAEPTDASEHPVTEADSGHQHGPAEQGK